MSDYLSKRKNVDPYLKKRRIKYLIVSLIVVIISIILIVIGVKIINKVRINAANNIPKQEEIISLWEAKNYSEISSKCSYALQFQPMNPFYLVFKGFAQFYLGIAETDGEKRKTFMDESVFLLKKSLLDKGSPFNNEAKYILGKAYYHKGLEYYHSALTYLKEAVDSGYTPSDIWEYLALSAEGTNQVELSLSYYDKAISIHSDSAELIISAAKEYLESGNSVRAESLTKRALGISTDEYLTEKAYFVLGDIYIKDKKYEEAMKCYDLVLEKNMQSADACYYKGIVYSEQGNSMMARAAWRKAIGLDPMHAQARQKLSER